MQYTVGHEAIGDHAASPGDRFVLGLIAGAVGGAIAAPIGFGLIMRQADWGPVFVAPFGAVAGAFWGGAVGFALPDSITVGRRLALGALLGIPCVAITPLWLPFMLIQAIATSVEWADYVALSHFGSLPAGLLLFAILWLGPGALAGLIGAWVLGRLERWWVGVRICAARR